MEPKKIDGARPERLDADFLVHFSKQTSISYKGIIDLFEHAYDEHFRFWFGVADFLCKHEDLTTQPYHIQNQDVSVVLTLPDGRQGTAKPLNMYYHLAENTPHNFVALSGIGPLMRPKDFVESFMGRQR